MRIHRDILGLDLLMDHGWIATLKPTMSVQVSFASDGGAGTPVPDLSIEVVDDVDAAMRAPGFDICCGRPTNRGAYVISMFATRSEPHTAGCPSQGQTRDHLLPATTCATALD